MYLNFARILFKESKNEYIGEFLYTYTNVLMKEIKDEEKAANILSYLFSDEKSNCIANLIDALSLDRYGGNSADVCERLVKE